MSCEIKFSLDVVLMRDRLFCHSQSPLNSYFTNILAQSRPDKQMKYKFLISVFFLKTLHKKVRELSQTYLFSYLARKAA